MQMSDSKAKLLSSNQEVVVFFSGQFFFCWSGGRGEKESERVARQRCSPRKRDSQPAPSYTGGPYQVVTLLHATAIT